MTLPVTQELIEIFAAAKWCPANTPYVAFLSTRSTCGQASAQQNFARLRKKLGIAKHITPHDFRRTTAVRVLSVTGDIRQVQYTLGHRRLSSTVHYLDHNLTRVERGTLEAAKLPPATELLQ